MACQSVAGDQPGRRRRRRSGPGTQSRAGGRRSHAQRSGCEKETRRTSRREDITARGGHGTGGATVEEGSGQQQRRGVRKTEEKRGIPRTRRGNRERERGGAGKRRIGDNEKCWSWSRSWSWSWSWWFATREEERPEKEGGRKGGREEGREGDGTGKKRKRKERKTRAYGERPWKHGSIGR
ncbi:hypothetical protein VTK73DRAFT_3503 [Phialemonium thermophilum]|uniref:Uncharacterized protein n=1 Tax=Phialemonium thermophilum TaxID=223376 RepID=A0ABR3VHS9_9PEZI